MLLISPALFESVEHSNFKTVAAGLSLENKNDPYENMTRIQEVLLPWESIKKMLLEIGTTDSEE